MKNILVVIPTDAKSREKLERAGEGCSLHFCDGKEVSSDLIREADGIIGQVDPALLDGAVKLKWLQLQSAGADPYIKPGVLKQDVVLTNATGAYGKAVAEHAFALTVMLQKKLHLYRDDQKKSVWGDHGTVTSLGDSVVAVIGLGDIGQYYAGLVKAMGAYVIGVKRRMSDKPDCVDEIMLTSELDRVLPRADVVMSVLPNTAETRHIYTRERFDLMKDSAVFINCGRGNAVASEVLYEALSTGKIQAAGVDVTETEPLPADSPLWQLDNLVITPHVSGFFHLPETYDRIIDIAAENLRAFRDGQPLRNAVDFSTGYKK